MQLETDGAYRMLYPRQVVLVSAGMEGPNALTVAWSTPLSFEPPLVGAAVAPKRHTHDMVVDDGAFGVNVPGRELIDETFTMGTVSGRDTDKFEETGLTVYAGGEGVPLIEECVASLECSLEEAVETGDHSLFLGRVENLYASEDALVDDWMNPEEPVYWRRSSERDVFGLEALEPE